MNVFPPLLSVVKRTLYRFLLQIHPPAFRRQFAAEMLWIFDEAAKSVGARPLCLDCLVSLARQWLLRCGSWKLAVAVLGACLQITAGGVIWLMFWRTRYSAEPLTSAHDIAAMGGLVRLILWLVGAVVLMVIAASLWVKSFIGKRTDRTPASL